MKEWMKALIWAGLGLGIGFFAGYQTCTVVNNRKGLCEPQEGLYEAVDDQEPDERAEAARNAARALKSYRGNGADTDGDEAMILESSPEELRRQLRIDEEEPEAESGAEAVYREENQGTATPKEKKEQEVRQLEYHDMQPCPITEEEFERNINENTKVYIQFYEGDEVFYRPDRQEIIPVPDDVFGFGAQFRFYGDPNNPTEVIYVENNFYGEIYEIELIHGYFDEIVEPSLAEQTGPADYEEDEDDSM